jgi:predicted short-subunit dehydrogenase-like oxidoreductase (DUF2520 family)
MKRSVRPRIAIIGTGKLARAFAPLLADRGYRIAAVAGRRPGPARSLCRTLRGASPTTVPERAAASAELILLAVPDREIASLAARLSRAEGLTWKGKTVLHHAGALGLEPLRPLERSGAAVGVLHPLQAFGDPAVAREVLPGSRARLEGTPKALVEARRLARDLELVPLRMKRKMTARERVAYHAAASLASNDLLSLLGLAVDLMQSAGLGRRAALEALAPLARGTLAQAERRGLGASLTGPVVRGDVETVAAHLAELERRAPLDATLHRLLSVRLLELAEREGHSLSEADRRRLNRLLASSSGGRGGGPTV